MLGTIDIKVRPLKFAYLVDPNSSEQVRESIKLNSTLWGGSYNPIIPLHKRIPTSWNEKPLKSPSAKQVILGYIDSFDPDILVQLSKEVPLFVKETGLRIIKPNEIWEQHGVYGNPLRSNFGVGIFDIFDDIFEKCFKYKTKYPVKVVIPKIPENDSLLYASMFGELPEKILSQMKDGYFEPLEIKEIEIDVSKIGDLFNRDTLFPRRIIEGNLNHFRHSGFRSGGAVVFYFDSSKILDIVDFWNLRALGRAVFPMPKQLEQNESLKKFLIEFLKSNRIPWKHQPSHCDTASMIRGRHNSMEDMQKFAQTINLKPEAGDVSQDGYFVLQHWYPRIWDEMARVYDSAEPNDTYEKQTSIEVTDAEKFRVQFKPVLPKFVKDKSFGGEPRCANEISFKIHGTTEYLAEVLPKSIGEKFIRAISSRTSFRNEWRTGRNGLVHLAKDTLTEYWDIPTSEKVFFAWLEDYGWTPELSNPGRLAKQIYKKLDGNVTILANENLIKMLDHMNGGEKLKKKSSTNVELEDGRDLAVDSVKDKLSDKNIQNKNSIYDYLISKGIFKVGSKMKCPNCSRKSWYSLEDLKDTCICPKCTDPFPAIGNIDASAWTYKTVGPFSIPQHADGTFSVLLGTNFFNEYNSSGVKLSPVFSFNAKNKAGRNLEADFAGFWQENSIQNSKAEGVLFAECKTYNKFQEKDFKRMSFLAKSFPGSVLVFCTLRKNLTKTEVHNLTQLTKTGRKYWKNNRPINPVLILTGTELSSYRGVPYCWSDEFQKKFDYIRGLLPICNATQQYYLKLPPWEEEWNKNWEKKNKPKAKTLWTKA